MDEKIPVGNQPVLIGVEKNGSRKRNRRGKLLILDFHTTAALSKYIMKTSVKSQTSNASLCSKCDKCESYCPQNIEIRAELATVAKTMEGFYYKPTRFLIKRFMKL